MSQNVLNWLSYAKAENARAALAGAQTPPLPIAPAREPAAAADPAKAILYVLGKYSQVALPDLAQLTSLTQDQLVSGVEELRNRGWAEVVTVNDGSTKFLQATSLGYAALTT